MKRIASLVLSAALLFSVSTSVFASKGPAPKEIYNKPIGEVIHPKYVESLIEKKEVEKVKAAVEAEIADLEENRKAIHEEIKN